MELKTVQRVATSMIVGLRAVNFAVFVECRKIREDLTHPRCITRRDYGPDLWADSLVGATVTRVDAPSRCRITSVGPFILCRLLRTVDKMWKELPAKVMEETSDRFSSADQTIICLWRRLQE